MKKVLILAIFLMVCAGCKDKPGYHNDNQPDQPDRHAVTCKEKHVYTACVDGIKVLIFDRKGGSAVPIYENNLTIKCQ